MGHSGSVFLLFLFYLVKVQTLDSLDVQVRVDLSRAIQKVDQRFLSIAIDASLSSKETFMSLLSSPKVRTLGKALSPVFLRFGGTRQDFMVFTPLRTHQVNCVCSAGSHEEAVLSPLVEERLKKEWAEQEVLLLKEDLQRNYRRVAFTEYTVDALNSFANLSGMDLIFGLNALLRTDDNRWNSSNAESLLRYCQSRGYRMSWELGNEPNSFEKKAGVRVDGDQLGRDFVHLRQILTESPFFHDAGLYGPDVSQPREHRMDLLEGFLQSGVAAVNACTWHHYYVNGRGASLEDFLDPEVLDSLAVEINSVLKMVNSVFPGKKVWLGETSSAFGGGASQLSDRFVAGFMWLDKLGLAAKLGLDVVIRQVFIGSGSYHLLDDNMDPLPDYWLSVLYKRLVGQEVLALEQFSHSGHAGTLRLYSHCANKNRYKNGAVTLIAMNLGRDPVRILLPAHLSFSAVEAFVLQSKQPGRAGLCSRSVKLNGNLMKMMDDQTLPPLEGSSLPAADHLQLPSYSLALYVFSDAAALACQ